MKGRGREEGRKEGGRYGSQGIGKETFSNLQEIYQNMLFFSVTSLKMMIFL